MTEPIAEFDEMLYNRGAINVMGNILNQTIQSVYIPYQISPLAGFPTIERINVAHQALKGFMSLPDIALVELASGINKTKLAKWVIFIANFEQNDVSMSDVGIMNINNTGMGVIEV